MSGRQLKVPCPAEIQGFSASSVNNSAAACQSFSVAAFAILGPRLLHARQAATGYPAGGPPCSLLMAF